MATAAARYERALQRFEAYLSVRGYVGGAAGLVAQRRLVAAASQYLRDCFASQEVGAGHMGDLIFALTRLCYMVGVSGGTVGAEDSSLTPLWRILRSWRLALPADFPSPVPQELCLAMGVRFLVRGPARLALAMLLGFRCPLRPGEACALERGGVTPFSPAVLPWYPGACGIVRVHKPKTQRMAQHAKVQVALIEDPFGGVRGALHGDMAGRERALVGEGGQLPERVEEGAGGLRHPGQRPYAVRVMRRRSKGIIFSGCGASRRFADGVGGRPNGPSNATFKKRPFMLLMRASPSTASRRSRSWRRWDRHSSGSAPATTGEGSRSAMAVLRQVHLAL